MNDVFSTIGTPVRAKNAEIIAWYRGCVSACTTCGRALPSTWTTAGSSRCAGRTGSVKTMNRASKARSNQSPSWPASTEGPKGRQGSRDFIAFTRACIAGSRGSARMLRPPSARGPNSIAP
ncbi:MAG: hypothetical protein U0325_34115 [Polyangiales bacterium]